MRTGQIWHTCERGLVKFSSVVKIMGYKKHHFLCFGRPFSHFWHGNAAAGKEAKVQCH
jgi:hypothetical protein